MWHKTKLTKSLKIKLPLIQAPMAGGATTTELVAAVSNAGGLGSLGAGYMQPQDIRQAIRAIRKKTKHPFNVNLFVPEPHQATGQEMNLATQAVKACCPELSIDIVPPKAPYAPPFDEQMQVLLEENVPVFSFTFGTPSKLWLNQFKENGITLMGTATHLEEAKYLEALDVDFIVVQGSEAGGHRGTFIGKAEDALIGIFSLVQQCVDYVRVPVIAAGGIMDARGILACLSLGATGVAMGTAFLSCTESGVSPRFKELLLNSLQDQTTLTRAFSGKFARGINNQFILRMQQYAPNILDYPIQNALTGPMRKEAAKQNNLDFMSLWAGQSHYLSRGLSVAAFIAEIKKDILAKVRLPSS